MGIQAGKSAGRVHRDGKGLEAFRGNLSESMKLDKRKGSDSFRIGFLKPGHCVFLQLSHKASSVDLSLNNYWFYTV